MYAVFGCVLIVYDFRMSFVPIRFLFLVAVALLPMTDARAQHDAACTPGWICGKAESHAARRHGIDARSQTCEMHHRVLPDVDRPGLFVSMFSSVMDGGGVDFGFTALVLRITPDRRAIAETPLRTIRIFSGNRRLDTKDWANLPPPAPTRGARVHKPVSEDALPELRTAFAVATGAAYGLIARTEAGTDLRFEIAAGPRRTDIVKEMQECLEERGRALEGR
jgi:hypothetical protein